MAQAWRFGQAEAPRDTAALKAQVNGLTFDSCFDSGNLGSVAQLDGGAAGAEEYLCTVRADCEGTPHASGNSSWFYFQVHGGARGRAVIFHIKTQNAQVKLYGNDMRPVYKAGDAPWQRIATRPDTQVSPNEQFFVISWPFVFDGDEPVSFAFTYPYPHTELCASMAGWVRKAKKSGVLCEASSIGRSLDGHPLRLLTITCPRGRDADKKIVLLSGRVHPGETPASHMLHGLIERLVDADDPVAKVLRQHYVFKIVPMLNPDGVVRGHYRTDTLGLNLNRMYEAPKVDKHPTIFAVKKLFKALHATGRLCMYIDFHAHATKRGCFMYGNALAGEKQAENLLLPKLLSLNTRFFQLECCNFSQKNMKMKGKKDGLSKKGTGRVALAAETGLVQCYTLEANYNRNLPTDADPCPEPYTIASFHEVGRAVLASLCDMTGRNPASVLPDTPYGSLQGVREALSLEVKRPAGPTASGRLAKQHALPTIRKEEPYAAKVASASFRTQGKL